MFNFEEEFQPELKSIVKASPAMVRSEPVVISSPDYGFGCSEFKFYLIDDVKGARIQNVRGYGFVKLDCIFDELVNVGLFQGDPLEFMEALREHTSPKVRSLATVVEFGNRPGFFMSIDDAIKLFNTLMHFEVADLSNPYTSSDLYNTLTLVLNNFNEMFPVPLNWALGDDRASTLNFLCLDAPSDFPGTPGEAAAGVEDFLLTWVKFGYPAAPSGSNVFDSDYQPGGRWYQTYCDAVAVALDAIRTPFYTDFDMYDKPPTRYGVAALRGRADIFTRLQPKTFKGRAPRQKIEKSEPRKPRGQDRRSRRFTKPFLDEADQCLSQQFKEYKVKQPPKLVKVDGLPPIMACIGCSGHLLFRLVDLLEAGHAPVRYLNALAAYAILYNKNERGLKRVFYQVDGDLYAKADFLEVWRIESKVSKKSWYALCEAAAKEV